MRKKPLGNAQLLFIVMVLLVGLAEAGLRIVYHGKFGKRPGFFIGDQRLGWRPAPNLNHTFYGTDFTMHVRTDAEGHRLGARGEVDPSVRLILLLGDSYTFGWGVDTDDTYASHLDELVMDASRGGMRVLNLGVGGYGTLQSGVCLGRFFDEHPEADVAAVVVYHVPNDPVDNVNSIGYHIGVWQVIDRQPKTRSHIHLVNFIDYVIAILGNKRNQSSPSAEEEQINPFLQDVAFAFDYKLPRSLPPTVTMNGRVVSLAGLSAEDYSKPATVERESMTRVQRDLTLEGVRSINMLLAERDLPVVHGIVPSAPPWFVREMTAILEESEQDDPGSIDLLGRFPDPDAYGHDYINPHSGGHYTPEFNAYWAEAVAKVLQAKGIVPSSDGP